MDGLYPAAQLGDGAFGRGKLLFPGSALQRQEQAAQTSSKLPLYVAVGIAVVCAGIVAAVLISRQLQNTQAQTQKQKDEKSAYHRKKGGK